MLMGEALTVILSGIWLLITMFAFMALLLETSATRIWMPSLGISVALGAFLYTGMEKAKELEVWEYEEYIVVSHYPSVGTYYLNGRMQTHYDGQVVTLNNGAETVINPRDEDEISRGMKVKYVKCVSSCVSVMDGWSRYYVNTIGEMEDVIEKVEAEFR